MNITLMTLIVCVFVYKPNIHTAINIVSKGEYGNA